MEMTPALLLQVIMALFTILGAGFSVYVAVRVALAEVKKDILYQQSALLELKMQVKDDIQDLRDKVKRLEQKYFT